MQVQGEFSVPRDASCVALARDFTRLFLARSGYTGSHDDAVLITSELVTNAIRHGRGDILLTTSADEHRMRIEVSDRSARRPRRRASGASGGWGLMLLTALSDAWGVDERGRDKVVWSELVAETASQMR